MQTPTPSSRLVRHLLDLLIGAVIAVALWLAGHVEIAWLGFAAAALYGDTPAWRRVRACLTRRPAA